MITQSIVWRFTVFTRNMRSYLWQILINNENIAESIYQLNVNSPNEIIYFNVIHDCTITGKWNDKLLCWTWPNCQKHKHDRIDKSTNMTELPKAQKWPSYQKRKRKWFNEFNLAYVLFFYTYFKWWIVHLCLAVKQTNGSIQNVQVIKMTPLIIGCMRSLVICNHLFLYIFIGAIELFVICKHW